MFPINCNAVGDIIAPSRNSSLTSVPLSDSRGSHKDFRDLNDELLGFKLILSSDVLRLVVESANVSLQQKVVVEVQ
jgi:hypothetical protein